MTKLTQSTLEEVVSGLSRGIIVPTLTPFDDDGTILAHAVADQARRFARIDGIVGIAVNTAFHRRETLSASERTDAIRMTRTGLDPGQLLLSHVGTLSDAALDETASCQAAGADAVIGSLVDWQKGHEGHSVDERIETLVDLVDRLPLPVIIAFDCGERRGSAAIEEIAHLARHCGNVLGFTMGADDDVMQYDQDYYALKSISRPLACLPASTGTLFHNLNTGADGVLSPFALMAPHEVAALYQASRTGRFLDAQALHNRLSPLIGLLSGHDQMTQEGICRAVAHHRGLLASTNVRGNADPLCSQLLRRIHQVVDETGLKPISWV
ncbi:MULTISPECIES: dihydrodipicolinate synthase family protein [Rhodobacterales]|uniref:Dihydrodipicolinate synthase family protein n=1 Tax=Pelagivirga sediminicola TaxID=2170575 RepID=A0A2T7G2R2_9RHOB|nr:MULTISPECIES: dihydrodipicolinate synthase family protein [Rhodobacterales]MCQ0090213.1 hypothetical protein [Roseovarius sp. M141]PVA08709.1 hypothetical protein DC366_17740 [Pelagivirga sediminicola]